MTSIIHDIYEECMHSFFRNALYIKRLIEDPNFSHKRISGVHTYMCYALRSGNPEVVEIILDDGRFDSTTLCCSETISLILANKGIIKAIIVSEKNIGVDLHCCMYGDKLLDDYRNFPLLTTRKLQAELGIISSASIQKFIYFALISKGCFRIKATPIMHRYHMILTKLPLHLQMIICCGKIPSHKRITTEFKKMQRDNKL